MAGVELSQNQHSLLYDGAELVRWENKRHWAIIWQGTEQGRKSNYHPTLRETHLTTDAEQAFEVHNSDHSIFHEIEAAPFLS